MTITLLPRRRPPEPTEAGKLAATLVSVAVAGMAEPSRFRRGRAYAADGAVTRIDVRPGALTGLVAGSRPEAYRVDVVAPVLAAAGPSGALDRTRAMRLVPDADELDVTCTCPDGAGSVCKHVVATLLAFAGEVGARPEVLLAWRTDEGSPGGGRRAGLGSARRERHLRLAPPPPPERATVDQRDPDGWHEFAGADRAPVPTLATLRAAAGVHDRSDRGLAALDQGVDGLTGVVASALEALRGAADDLAVLAGSPRTGPGDGGSA